VARQLIMCQYLPAATAAAAAAAAGLQEAVG